MSNPATPQTTDNNKPQIFYARKYMAINLLVGIVMVVLGGLLAIAEGTAGPMLGIGIACILIGIALGNMHFVTLSTDEIILKRVPLQAATHIRLNEISSIKTHEKRVNITYTPQDASEKMEEINLTVMNAADKRKLLKAIEQYLSDKMG